MESSHGVRAEISRKEVRIDGHGRPGNNRRWYPLNTAPFNLTADFFARPAQENHFVLFYEREEVLHDEVAQYLGAGLNQSEPALVIATQEHWIAIRAKLEARSFDIERALGSGQLTVV